MRNALRRVAFVGDLELSVTEALRALGCRVERIDGTSVVAVARDLMCIRPAVVHARSAHLKVGLVARLLNVPLVVQAGRGDVNAITARAARVAERTLCATVSLREALVEQGAPPSTTPTCCSRSSRWRGRARGSNCSSRVLARRRVPSWPRPIRRGCGAAW